MLTGPPPSFKQNPEIGPIFGRFFGVEFEKTTLAGRTGPFFVLAFLEGCYGWENRRSVSLQSFRDGRM